jgi:hypothetical protein
LTERRWNGGPGDANGRRARDATAFDSEWYAQQESNPQPSGP